MLGNIAESRAARNSSNFAIYGAKEDQILAGYNADTWTMTHLNKGDIVYGGLPGQSNYYTTQEALLSSQGNKNILYTNLQVRPPNLERGGYMPNIGEYVVTQDIRIPTGIVSAKPALGPGGERQFFYFKFWKQIKFNK